MLTTVTTCLHCGTLNQAAAHICAVCGGGLAVDPSFGPPDYEPIADPDLFTGIQPFSFTHALSTTLKLFIKQFSTIAKIVVVIVTPLEILKATTLANVTDDLQVRLVTTLLGAACNILIAPALIYALTKV